MKYEFQKKWENYSNYENAKEQIDSRWSKIYRGCEKRNDKTCTHWRADGENCMPDICPRIGISIRYIVKY